MKGNAYIDQWFETVKKSERYYNGAWPLAWGEKQ